MPEGVVVVDVLVEASHVLERLQAQVTVLDVAPGCAGLRGYGGRDPGRRGGRHVGEDVHHFPGFDFKLFDVLLDGVLWR